MKALKRENQQKITVGFLLKCLLFSYLVTGMILILLAFVLYQFGIGQNIVKGVIILTYVISTFFAGFIAGKKMHQKKFLWGLILGLVYFLILAVMSLAVNHSVDALGNSFFSTMILCAGGGMLGGMMS